MSKRMKGNVVKTQFTIPTSNSFAIFMSVMLLNYSLLFLLIAMKYIKHYVKYSGLGYPTSI